MDAEEGTQVGPDEEEEVAEAPEPVAQSDNDFMAGAMLANGIVFVWMQALSVFRGFASQLPPRFLVDVSYIIYLLAGYISSRQVIKRAKRDYLKAGLKTAAYSTIMGLLILSSMNNEQTVGLAITLGICYFAGSILGSYIETKDRLKRLRVEASS
jgi:hypothetical protein